MSHRNNSPATRSDHPHYAWLAKELADAEAKGDQDVVLLLRSGLGFALACNEAWHRALAFRQGQLLGLEFQDAKQQRFAVILEDASEPGRYRAQYFDANGISGHATRDSAEEVLEELVRDGYRELAPGAMQRLSQTRDWSLGTLMANLIAQVNAGRMTYRAMQDEMAKAATTLF
ncbi:hypothetical protein DFO67_11538 [Modicisalibacter xianhensis]|uniref:Uncharacterized protein n=1 Tax=Modicisalibacter xianhensis TaxID=442341 RepID=A0A4V3GTJ4_9GAMM|nr:hypothetical protein [Halomonas xianhensis]TDX26773.1 hypothetical protein DFO67_11538 [Halomonas xianhensis]